MNRPLSGTLALFLLLSCSNPSSDTDALPELSGFIDVDTTTDLSHPGDAEVVATTEILEDVSRWSDVQDGLVDAPSDLPTDRVPDGDFMADLPPDLGPQPWRSALYPEDWSPGFTDDQGRLFHDFSYAGYHNSDDPLPEPTELMATVVVEDADPSGEADSTAAIQAAVDLASSNGGTVLIPAGLYRVDGLLTVTASKVVIRGEGAALTRLFFSRNDGMSDTAHITFAGALTTVHEAPVVADLATLSNSIPVADAAAFAPGDDVSLGWVISDEFVADHGMTGTWKAFNGTWQPFFRRTVVAVDLESEPNVVLLDVPTRYPALLRDSPTLRKETGYLSEVGIADLGISTATDWDAAWTNERSHGLALKFVKDGWVQRVVSFASPLSPTEGPGAGAHLQNGGIRIHGSKRVTVADSVMEKAQNRGGGGCGYLFEIRVSSEVLTRDCIGREGRHNFIQNWGFGTSGCVWLRCTTEGGLTVALKDFPDFGGLGFSEFHHSLATANLIDSNVVHDGWKAANRNDWSTGAGHTATENVFWNMTGSGEVVSRQFGWGYIVGTGPELTVRTNLNGGFDEGKGTEPEDWLEGVDVGALLEPQSLFEDQLARRHN